MKKVLNYIFISICLYILTPIIIFAAGSIKPTTSSLSVRPGGTTTFTIKASNATGKVNISSSNTGIATVSTSSHWMDNDSFTVTVRGVAAGTATITVSLSDAATYDEEELHGSYSINVNVSSSSSSNNVINSPKPEVKNDATLSKLEISGYNLEFKKEKTEYSLEIPNDVVELKVDAVPNKSTSKAEIRGNKDLVVGENTIKIDVTSADGTIKKYRIKVIRKDEIPETVIDNLSNTLKNTTKDTIALKIKDSNEISSEILKQVKEANKNLIINIYNNENKLLYSWNIITSSINEKNKYDFGISFSSKKQDEILKLTNYSEMLNLSFNYSGDLPKGTNIKIFVGDKFADDEKLNLYYYNEVDEIMEAIDENLKVENGFVEIQLEHCSEYILTRAKLINTKDTINATVIISIIEGIVIIVLLILFIKKEKKLNKDKIQKKIKDIKK